MNCSDFLARHTEYVDGVIDANGAERLAAHARACASCARYDRIVRRGPALLREVMPNVAVSSDFEARVRHRLYHERDDARHRRAGSASVWAAAASVVFALAGAGAFALLPERTPVVDAQIVFAATPRAFTPVETHAFVAPVTRVRAATPKDAEPVSPLVAEARGHDAHLSRPAAWPVYSRDDAAVAFPAPKAELRVKPVDFRARSAVYRAGPILVRH